MKRKKKAVLIVRHSPRYGYLLGDQLFPPNFGTFAFPVNRLIQALGIVWLILKLKKQKPEAVAATANAARHFDVALKE